MSKEALKLALEAYLCREMPAGTIIGDPKWWVPKIASAIKVALAQPEQEPVAWMDAYQPWDLYKNKPNLEALPLYTTPPQRTWVGLTDEERMELAVSTGAMSADWLPFMEAVEAKLKEKNT